MELEMKVVEALARLVGIAEIDGMDDQSNVWRSAMLDANSLLEEIDALNSVEVKVRIVCLAQGAYASIASPEGSDEHFVMDVLLPAGKSAHHGLYERADELEKAALDQLKRVRRMRAAAATLEKEARLVRIVNTVGAD